jgi:hypothetical protein
VWYSGAERSPTVDPLIPPQPPLCARPHLYLWVSSPHDDTIPTLFRILIALIHRALPRPRLESFALVSYVYYTAHVFPSCVLMPRRSSAPAVGQYGRNKDKGKAREASSAPNRGVTSPAAAAESRKEPSVDDTVTSRTTNGHRAMSEIGKRGVSEPSLHSPVSQRAPKSPGLPNSARASTDAITHVSPLTVTHLD